MMPIRPIRALAAHLGAAFALLLWLAPTPVSAAGANPCAHKMNPCNPCAKKMQHNPCNPCAHKMNPCAHKAHGMNPCNPCGKKKMGHNPCNPCGQKMNPCAHKMNPCSHKMNPCSHKMNPCAHKMNPCGAHMNPCGANPCGGAKVSASRFLQPAGVQLAKGNSAELLALGEKLWNDRALGKSGLACSTCHNAQYSQMNPSFAKPYPHRVAMPYQQAGVDRVSAAEMVNFCMMVPMATQPLPWGSRELAALTSYVQHIQPGYRATAAHSGSRVAANPCAGHNPCGMRNPCAAKLNPCSSHANPCRQRSPRY